MTNRKTKLKLLPLAIMTLGLLALPQVSAQPVEFSDFIEIGKIMRGIQDTAKNSEQIFNKVFSKQIKLEQLVTESEKTLNQLTKNVLNRVAILKQKHNDNSDLAKLSKDVHEITSTAHTQLKNIISVLRNKIGNHKKNAWNVLIPLILPLRRANNALSQIIRKLESNSINNFEETKQVCAKLRAFQAQFKGTGLKEIKSVLGIIQALL